MADIQIWFLKILPYSTREKFKTVLNLVAKANAPQDPEIPLFSRSALATSRSRYIYRAHCSNHFQIVIKYYKYVFPINRLVFQMNWQAKKNSLHDSRMQDYSGPSNFIITSLRTGWLEIRSNPHHLKVGHMAVTLSLSGGICSTEISYQCPTSGSIHG